MRHYYIFLYQNKKIEWRHIIAHHKKDLYKTLDIQRESKLFLFQRDINFSSYRKKHLLPFAREFLFLLRNGLSYLEAFKIMKNYDSHLIKKKMLEDIISSIQQGKSIVEAFSINSSFFGKFFLKVLYIGEESGNVENILELLISEMEEYLALKKQISSLLSYPCFLLFFSGIILIFLFLFIFPKLLSLFQDTGMTLPLFTRVLIKIKYIIPFLFVFFMTFFLLIYIILGRKHSEKTQSKIDSFIFRKFYCSGCYAKMVSLRMAKYLGLLLRSGFSFQETFSILEKEIDNIEFYKRFCNMKKRIYKGERVHIAFQELGCFSEKDLYFIALGEEGGNIEEIFQKIAVYKQQELKQKIHRYLLWLEPSIFIIFGLCIGVIVIAVYLPMFSLSNML